MEIIMLVIYHVARVWLGVTERLATTNDYNVWKVFRKLPSDHLLEHQDIGLVEHSSMML